MGQTVCPHVCYVPRRLLWHRLPWPSPRIHLGAREADAPSPVTAALKLEPSDRSGGPTRPSEDLRWTRGEANNRWPGQPFGPNPSADLVGAPEGNSYAVTPRRTGPEHA